ncbi:hypothetical protein [uncultured Desulfobulbus sp.]|uniref:hypothetical protein n=1 Tax=uncultured Desulfobulbus sp. TaxID=239745 RepID=UPI0029C71AB9|nr:hypothetical protein [uncultured Desulfobulbus sp.]
MTAFSIALLSFLLLALQIIWIQALGYAQGHHLAYVIISIALLGFGAGGSVLTLWQKPGSNLEKLYAPCLLLCALATALLPLMACPLLAVLEVDLLHMDRGQWLRLAALGGVIFLPFFLGATALAVAFSVRAETIGRLYAANLLGSAAGAGASLVLLRLALPEQIMPWLAFIPLLAVLPAHPRRTLFFLTVLGVVPAVAFSPPLPRSPYKALSYALQLPEVHHEGPLPHPLGRVDIVRSPAQRYAPDLSLHYTGPVPAPPHLFIDGEDAGNLLHPADPAALILAETPRALPFAAGPVGTVLCLSPGGTPLLNVAATLSAQVTAIEPHPRIAELVRPLLKAGATTLYHADPRLFLARQVLPPQDLIIFPERGLFGGPAGLQTLGEDTLFTVEALRSAWSRLAPDGKLAFNVWLDEPLRHAPRLVDLVACALRAEGIERPGDHMAIVRGWSSLSILAGREPIRAEALARITSFAAEKGYDVLWPPGDVERRHGFAGEPLDRMIALLLSPHPEELIRNYRFDIRAPVDDRPFFNQFLRLGERSSDLDFLSVSERGLLFLQALLIVLTAAVLFLVFAPLLPLHASLSRAPFTLLFFAGIGAGFMCFEVALIQRLTLLWGSPVTSAALVIMALLCGMGLGSSISRLLPARPGVLTVLVLGIAIMQAILLPMSALAVEHLLAASAAVRFGGGIALLVLCAIPLGMPFPLGIRLLSAHPPGQIPWACGIDSAFAVITAPAAGLLAFQMGFSSLALASAAAYLLAALGALAARR